MEYRIVSGFEPQLEITLLVRRGLHCFRGVFAARVDRARPCAWGVYDTASDEFISIDEHGNRVADDLGEDADERPADELPADELPADERPAYERPAGERLADERLADDGRPTFHAVVAAINNLVPPHLCFAMACDRNVVSILQSAGYRSPDGDASGGGGGSTGRLEMVVLHKYPQTPAP